MAQSSQPHCTQCGTPIPPGQRFCSNCGASTDPGFSKPTSMASGEHNQQVPEMPTEFSAPPPPPASFYTPPAQPTPAPGTYYPPQQEQSFPPQQGQNFPPQQAYQSAPAPVPAYAKPQKDSSRSVLGQMSCGILVVILIIVGICGGASFVAYKFFTAAASSTSTNTSTNSNTTTNGNVNGTPQAIPTTTTQVNATVTYASVDVTIVNAQKASSYTDDTSTNTPYIVRINLKEHNPTANDVFLFYSDNFHLILPDGSSVVAGAEQTNGGVGQAVTRNNWVDFPVTTNVDVSKLILRIGGAAEAQMDVPLTASPDVSKYQPKTITPNTAFNYAGLNWTLTSVTSSWSANGKQATTGMRYIVVTLKVNNPTQNTFYLFASDNARLQAGTTTSPPTDNTLNSAIAAGTTGTTGTITFLMPQNASAFSLLFLAQPNTTPPATQVTTNFQI